MSVGWAGAATSVPASLGDNGRMTRAKSLRVYVPVLHRDLDEVLTGTREVTGFGPDRNARALTGEALEEAEWFALDVAAGSIAGPAAQARSPRCVVACDAPGDLAATALVDGVEAVGPFALTAAEVVSFHVDDPAVTDGLPEDPATAADVLAAEALLWFDATELETVRELYAQN